MKKSKISMKNAGEVEIVFYEAFMQGDYDVMAAVWSADNSVCVHPGSRIIVGYESVMRSWKHILENVERMDIQYHVESKLVTDELAIHVVTEEILENNNLMATVVATNSYKKFANGWLMVEHHGSLVNKEQTSATLQ